jgi:RimJ/RimL family protein N-acetyltransferase
MALAEVIATPRLLLRRYTSGDATRISALIEPERERLLESFGELARGLRTGDDAEAFVADKAALWASGLTFCYGIRRRGADRQVKNVQGNIPSAELSYFIGAAHLRQGFAREALDAVLHETFEVQRFERIYLRILPANQGSLALAKRLGFRHEGLHRSEFRCGRGEIHDVHDFALVAPEYQRFRAIVPA